MASSWALVPDCPKRPLDRLSGSFAASGNKQPVPTTATPRFVPVAWSVSAFTLTS